MSSLIANVNSRDDNNKTPIDEAKRLSGFAAMAAQMGLKSNIAEIYEILKEVRAKGCEQFVSDHPEKFQNLESPTPVANATPSVQVFTVTMGQVDPQAVKDMEKAVTDAAIEAAKE